MKITQSELSEELQKKIDQLENVKKTASDSSFITYNGTEFVNKKVNSLNLAKVISADEIYSLGTHLYKSEKNYVSSFDTILLDGNSGYGYSKFLNRLNGSFLFNIDSTIIKMKTYGTFLLILDRSGKMHKINKSDPSIKKTIDIMDIITSNFVYTNFDVYSITDFEWYNDGVLVSTELNGIFYFSFKERIYDLKIPELDVKSIFLLSDGKTLVITKSSEKNNIIVYNLELNKKINIFNQLSKYYQQEISHDVDAKNFYILGKTYSVNQSPKLLHMWQLDAAGIDYQNMDRQISDNSSDNSYRPKIVKHDSHSIFVIGLKNNKLCLWDYTKENIRSKPTEVIYELEDIEYDDIKDFDIINNRIYVALKTKLLVFDTDFKLLENYYLNINNGFDFISVTKNGVFAISGKECYAFHIPAKKYQKIIDIKLDTTNGECNNMDIMINAPKDTQIIFIDNSTGQKISPYYYLKMENIYHVIKLVNNTANDVTMRIGVYENDKIDAIVIHKNRIFYK